METLAHTQFAQDTLKGLTSTPKYLLPRYFYDEQGSKIFQDIMNMPEYYVTDCEWEIFSKQARQIIKAFCHNKVHFDLIELGSGDGLKTRLLLRELISLQLDFTFKPVDISAHAMDEFVSRLQHDFPSLQVEPLIGDYFHLFDLLGEASSTPKVIMFLGANIGNFNQEKLYQFLEEIKKLSNQGDQLLIGFDMIKSPEVIINAYSDPHGHTAAFNLNLLSRVNRELHADFRIENFEHHSTFNPQTGAVKSFLVSKEKQQVHLDEPEAEITFDKWEAIFMELSQKYSPAMIATLADKFEFTIEQNFTDSREYFTDSLWIKK